MSISILILTKDEERDLPACLASVSWSDDVHVLDSFSSDSTEEIALNKGARVTKRKFDGYSSQRNAGLELGFKYEWVLIVDADEIIPAELARELLDFVYSATSNVGAARIRRHDIWWGRWLKYAQISPYYIRLVRIGRAHYEREINEVIVIDGDVVDIREHFDHYPFSKGFSHWILKHNIYSGMEANIIFNNVSVAPSWRHALFSKDFNNRRLHQKAMFYRLPGRPIIKFLYMFFWRCAFLDGWAGIRYAIIQCIYEYFIVLKTKEMKYARKFGKAP